MVVGIKEKHDVTFDRRANVVVGTRYFSNQSVYGDTRDKKRRDVFVPSQVGFAPQSARIFYMNKEYRALLSFRIGIGRRKIPVFTWRVR